MAAVEAYIARHAPGATVAEHPVIGRARARVCGAARALRAVPDDVLASRWDWQGGENEVRYGFYRIYEIVEGAIGAVAVALPPLPPSEARASVQAATEARWDLHGLLEGLDDAALDADPGGEEWSVRVTLGHTVETQRAYAWASSWWLARRDAPADDFPTRWPEDEAAQLPGDAAEGAGTMDEIRARFDATLDGSSSRYATLDPDEMLARGRWSGRPLTVGFRLWRWSSHIREHTIQVEKTLPMIGRQPGETARLNRLILAAYGRLEARVFGVDPAAIDRAGADRRSAAAIIDAAADQIAALGAEVAAAGMAHATRG